MVTQIRKKRNPKIRTEINTTKYIRIKIKLYIGKGNIEKKHFRLVLMMTSTQATVLPKDYTESKKSEAQRKKTEGRNGKAPGIDSINQDLTKLLIN